MAYCRGEVYAVSDLLLGGFSVWESNGAYSHFDTQEELLSFLQDARTRGLAIPDSAFERLRREISTPAQEDP